MEYRSLKSALPYHLPVLVQTALSLSLFLCLSGYITVTRIALLLVCLFVCSLFLANSPSQTVFSSSILG